MDRGFLTLGALSAGLAVALGAFAAHGLKARLDPQALATFEVGARYQMYHALALLAVGLLAERWPGQESGLLVWSGALFLAGTLLFSGSLYALGLTGFRWLGAITPFGGVAFLAGWGCLAAAALRLPRSAAP
ncbi:MAG: DUF423 domain-containing protein [Thermoanaerobaculia bacterium]